MTTIVLGEEERCLEAFVDFDVPLWQCISSDTEFYDITRMNPASATALLVGVAEWVERRSKLGDIKQVDPTMEQDCLTVQKALDAQTLASEKVKDHQEKIESQKIQFETAVKVMLQLKKEKLGKDMDTATWEASEIFTVNKKLVDDWRNGKLEVLEKAHRILLDEEKRLTNELEGLCKQMYEKARVSFDLYQKEHKAAPVEGDVDAGLLHELESLCIDELPASVVPQEVTLTTPGTPAQPAEACFPCMCDIVQV